MRPEVVLPVVVRGLPPATGERSPSLAGPHHPPAEAFRQVFDRVKGQLDAAQAPATGLRFDPGAELSPTALLALQAQVYRHGELVDLASRVVDRACEAVKTVIRSG